MTATATDTGPIDGEALGGLLAARPDSQRMLDSQLTIILASVTERETVKAFVRAVLGPVLANETLAAKMIPTLLALWQHENPKAAALALGIHHKTVNHRLKVLENKTGLAFVLPGHRLYLCLGLLLCKSCRGLPQPGDPYWSTVPEVPATTKGNGHG